MFIAVEGIDGVGKTTVARKLRDRLALAFPDREVLFSRAPDGPIREVLLDRGTNLIDAKGEVLLFLAAHRWLLSNVVFPALKRGAIVVQDRFTDSTIAYQGGGRQLDTAWMFKMIEENIKYGYEENELRAQLPSRYAYRMRYHGVQPDHTLYVTAPRHVSEARIKTRGGEDFMDLAGPEFRERVAKQMRIQKNMHDTEHLRGESLMVVSEIPNAQTMDDLDRQIGGWIAEYKEAILVDLMDMSMPGNPFVDDVRV